jgi:uncharacterized protein (DUF362 family)
MKSSLTRRDWLIAAGVTAAGIAAQESLKQSPKRSWKSRPHVRIERASSYSQDLYSQLRRTVTEHKLNVRGKRVVLKPNLVEFDSHTCINTHPMVVHAAFEAFRSLGADVRIAEGPGHRRITLDLAEAAGYFGIIPNFEDLFTDLNLDEVTERPIAGPVSKLGSVFLPRTVLNCDLLVSMPKMKTHHWAGATLSMKNLFGTVPGGVYGWPKNVLHWAGIPECIADLYGMFPQTFAIVDGIYGMEGNGPIQGTPRYAGLLVSGRDLAAVDATCCRLMGINPERVEYLRLAVGERALASAAIEQTGESVAHCCTNFNVLPQFEGWRLRA